MYSISIKSSTFLRCFMFCCALLCVHSSFTIISMGKRELVALLCLSSWCLVIVVWLFLVMPWVCRQFVIVVFPVHTHLLFLIALLLIFPELLFSGLLESRKLNKLMSHMCYA